MRHHGNCGGGGYYEGGGYGNGGFDGVVGDVHGDGGGDAVAPPEEVAQ